MMRGRRIWVSSRAVRRSNAEMLLSSNAPPRYKIVTPSRSVQCSMSGVGLIVASLSSSGPRVLMPLRCCWTSATELT